MDYTKDDLLRNVKYAARKHASAHNAHALLTRGSSHGKGAQRMDDEKTYAKSVVEYSTDKSKQPNAPSNKEWKSVWNKAANQMTRQVNLKQQNWGDKVGARKKALAKKAGK